MQIEMYQDYLLNNLASKVSGESTGFHLPGRQNGGAG